MAWQIRGNPKVVFGDPKTGPEYLRLMLALNVLETLHRPLLETMTAGYEARTSAAVRKGDQLVLLGLVYGALSEAIDAYAAFRGTIEALALRANSELQPSLDVLRKASHKDKHDSTTFLNRIARRVRVEVGFHWDKAAIGSTMDRLTSTDAVLFRSDPSPSGGHLARYTFADEVMAKVAFPQASRVEMEEAIAEALQVTQALNAVVEAAIAQFMLDAGCQRTEV